MEMEGREFLKRCSLVVAILTVLSLKARGVEGRVYMVGDEEEWNSQTNFDLWRNTHNFSVGDVLVFKYVKGEHNVYEVTEDTYRSCDASSGILAKYESGEDEVALSEARTYWFICSIAGHCLGGMRFGIQVKQTNNAALSPQLQPPPFNNSHATQSYWRVIIGLLSFMLHYIL